MKEVHHGEVVGATLRILTIGYFDDEYAGRRKRLTSNTSLLVHVVIIWPSHARRIGIQVAVALHTFPGKVWPHMLTWEYDERLTAPHSPFSNSGSPFHFLPCTPEFTIY